MQIHHHDLIISTSREDFKLLSGCLQCQCVNISLKWVHLISTNLLYIGLFGDHCIEFPKKSQDGHVRLLSSSHLKVSLRLAAVDARFLGWGAGSWRLLGKGRAESCMQGCHVHIIRLLWI
jgi:hypothetical protein